MAFSYDNITYEIIWLARSFTFGIFALLTSVICFILVIVAYRLSIHPLASVPGPRLAATSNIWHAYHARNGRMHRLEKSLHKIYGPVVRVGPNEIWFNSKEACQMIYGTGSGFKKSDFYLATSLSKPEINWKLELHFPDTLDLLSEQDMKRYRLQRRFIGPVYQTANLIKYEAAIDDVLDKAVVKLKSLKGTEITLNEWMHIIAVECLGAVVLSWSPGMFKAASDWGTGAHAYQGWRRKSVFGLFPFVTKLEHISKSFGRVFSSIWSTNFQPPARFRAFFPDVTKRVSRRSNAALRPKPPKDDRQDLLMDLIQLHKNRPEFKDMYLRKMAITNFGAGHETMASTMTSIMCILGSNKDAQDQLRNELLAIQESTKYSEATQLPILQAVIKESRRLYPVINMSLPRTVPPYGLRLHGYFFPSGTTVGCNPLALQRNPDIFGESPDEFDLNRWMDIEAARTMERYSLAWGGGARTCPGRNLAELVVSKVVTRLVREFQIEAKIPDEENIQTYFLAILTEAKARFIAQ